MESRKWVRSEVRSRAGGGRKWRQSSAELTLELLFWGCVLNWHLCKDQQAKSKWDGANLLKVRLLSLNFPQAQLRQQAGAVEGSQHLVEVSWEAVQVRESRTVSSGGRWVSSECARKREGCPGDREQVWRVWWESGRDGAEKSTLRCWGHSGLFKEEI